LSDQSTGRPWSTPAPRKGPATQVAELKDLVVGYAKQETVDPLKTLGRYLGFGFAGSAAIGLGLFLLLLALLRGLQQIEFFNEPGEATGGAYSWAPYFITGLVGTLMAVGFLWRLIAMARKQDAQ
jgi:Putative Actinobacterial Holin-X, holin superfamily III